MNIDKDIKNLKKSVTVIVDIVTTCNDFSICQRAAINYINLLIEYKEEQKKAMVELEEIQNKRNRAPIL